VSTAVTSSPVDAAERIEGWMDRAELQWLYATAQKMDTIAELGSWKGRSSYALAAGVRERLYCVDTFRGSAAELETNHAEAKEGRILHQFMLNLAELIHHKVITVVCDHNEAAPQMPDVDMVFLDGSHDYVSVLANIKAWKPKARKLFAGHDINWPGVARAVAESFPGEPLYWAAGSIWFVRMGEK
jgi:predicted O-methyltransferase YrrM